MGTSVTAAIVGPGSIGTDLMFKLLRHGRAGGPRHLAGDHPAPDGRAPARGGEGVGGAARGRALLRLNGVEPPMIMRNTVFCAIPAEAAEAGPQRDAIEANIRAMVETVRRYVPGYTLRADPQFDGPDERWRGMARVGVFLEVRGRGDYLPDYAGNLDIMTSAAAQVAELLATGVPA